MPAWLFVGLALIALLAALMWRDQRIHEKQRKEMDMARTPTPDPTPSPSPTPTPTPTPTPGSAPASDG